MSRRGQDRPSTTSVVLTVGRDDLLHLVRDRTALFFMIVMPIVVIVIIGLTIGAMPDNAPLGIVDLDGSPAAAAVRQRLADSGVVSLRSFRTEDDLRQDVRVQNLAAGIVIPAGFGADLDRPTAGEPATLVMVVDPTQQSAQALATVVRSTVAREGEVVAAARFATEQVGGDPAVNGARARGLAATVPTVPVAMATQGQADPAASGSRYSYTTIGNLVLFVFINTLAGAGALIERRRLGISRRMLAAPLSVRTVVAGTWLSRFAIALGQSLLIVAVGSAVFSVGWGTPTAAVLLVVVWAALATSLSLLVGSLAANADQAQAVAIPVAIGLAMLGGCMWPLEIVPPGLRALGHLTPHAWVMDAWMKVAFERGTVADIVGPLLVLLAFTGVLVALANVALRRALTEG
jgi:ABC-2 type transport system permease protein